MLHQFQHPIRMGQAHHCQTKRGKCGPEILEGNFPPAQKCVHPTVLQNGGWGVGGRGGGGLQAFFDKARRHHKAQRHLQYPQPLCNSYALVQATVGIGTVLIWYLILIRYKCSAAA